MELKAEMRSISETLEFLKVSGKVSAPWKHLKDGLAAYMQLHSELFKLGQGSGGTEEEIKEVFSSLERERSRLHALADALAAASRDAGPAETPILDFLDALALALEQDARQEMPSAGQHKGTSPDLACVEVIRETRGCCSECQQDVPAQVRIREGSVWLDKQCQEHGQTSQFLSDNPDYWAELDCFYFRVNKEEYPQRDFIIRMTERCNLDCPICLAKANTEDTPDLSLDEVQGFIRARRGIKIDLMAAEPTLREDLEEWVRTIKGAGNIAALHTNGLKLAKREYAERLKVAGVDEVFLQFDGFDDEAHVTLRGRKLLKARLAALDNLRELGIATSLIVVVARGVNEAEVKRTLDFAASPDNAFIREVFFLGLRVLGSAADRGTDGKGPFEGLTMMPDEVIELLTAQDDRISRSDVLAFNKLYFAMLGLFKVRKCLYVQHYMMVRDKAGGLTPISDLLDLPRLEAAAERFAAKVSSHPLRARARFLASLSAQIMKPSARPVLRDLLRLQALFRSGMNLKDVPPRLLLLGFITACDPENFDSDVAINCGKGELSSDGGFVDSGAVANVHREARFVQSDRRPGALKARED